MEIIQKIFNQVLEETIKEFSDLEESQREERINKLIESIPNLIDNISLLVKDSLDNKRTSMLKERRNIIKGFENKHKKLWEDGLNLLETFLVICFEAGEDFNNAYREDSSKSNDFKFDVLTRLHSRSIQVGYEVLTLLKSGYADGAHARWRTLHEITVVGLFINKNDQETAEKYLLHELVDSYKAMIQYQKYCEQLNQPPFPKEKLIDTKSLYDKLINKYGVDFAEPYGWAATCLNKHRINFSDIEIESGLEHLRPYYKMASYNVHASSKGIKFRLGLSDTFNEVLLSGPSNYGLADPGHGVALSLSQITSALLIYRNNFDHLVILKILDKYCDEIGEAFLLINDVMKE